MTPEEREAWLGWRREGVTATDIAKTVTGKYGGMFAVVAEKLGRVGERADVPQEGVMRRGTELEPVVGHLLQICDGRYVIGAQSQVEHPTAPVWRATLDGYLSSDGVTPEAVCELKTRVAGAKGVWDYWRAQVSWQMFVTGLDEGVLCVAWVDDSDRAIDRLSIEKIRPAPAELLMLEAAGRRILEHVNRGELPDPDGSPEATDLIGQFFAKPTKTDPKDTVDLTDLDGLISRRVHLADQQKQIKSELSEINNRLKTAVGTHTRGEAPSGTVSWSKPANILDDQAVLEAHPEFAKQILDKKAAEEALGKKGLDQFRTPKGARRLTIKPTKTHSN